MARARRTPDPRTAYITAFSNAMVRKLRARRPVDAHDIAQTEALAILPRLDAIMARYPNATTFASVRTPHALVQWDRGQNAQRGSGSRYIVNPDGSTSPLRAVLPLDSAFNEEDGTELSRRISVDNGDVAERVADSMHTVELLERCLLGMSDTDRQLLMLVDGHGVSVSDVAAARGTARETMSRHISKLRAHARRNAAQLVMTT